MSKLEIIEQVIKGGMVGRSIDEWLPTTIRFVQAIVSKHGGLNPMAWLFVDDDVRLYVGNFCDSQDHKEGYAKWMRQHAKEINAWGYGFASEAWSATANITKDATPEEAEEARQEFVSQFDGEHPVRDYGDKMEVVLITLETKDNGNKTVTMKLERDETGATCHVIDKSNKTESSGLLTNMLSC